MALAELITKPSDVRLTMSIKEAHALMRALEVVHHNDLQDYLNITYEAATTIDSLLSEIYVALRHWQLGVK